MALVYAPSSSKKQRAKRKPTKAQQEAENNFKLLNAKWDTLPKFGGKYGTIKKTQTKNVEPVQRQIDVAIKPRVGKFDVGSTAKPAAKTYTGTKVLGVATMHKSSAVPVFSAEEAEEIARMRR